MATSPLFGWEEPDDTDLVKDGAAAIRTLGNAIDTSMGDLLGGTTGQVLSKASNTNMDFTWVTENDADAIQNAIVDAKGDLIAASAADTPARLAVGANGTSLVADSSTATGLKWQADTVNTVIDAKGDLLAGSAADTLTRLGVGANNTVLTADSATATGLKWATPGSSGLVKIVSNTFSNVASVTIDSVFSSTYKNYVAFITIYAATSTDDLQMQLRYAGPTTQASAYYGSQFTYNRSNTLTTAGYNFANQATLMGNTGGATATSFLNINFSQVGNSSQQALAYGQGLEGDNQGIANFAMFQDVSRIYTGFLLKSSSSNITGSYAIYGLEA